MSIDSSLGSTAHEAVAVTSDDLAKPQEEQEKSQSTLSSTSILSTLCAPFSALLSGSQSKDTPESNNEHKQEAKIEDKEPEAYYAPSEVPMFKKLQKKRLSGTRTKQLLRAAGRAYNDPPPPPELGSCCGSSCDPCVNTLWREERDVWRERWGDRKVENVDENGRKKELEW
ncbi:hypothetical protein N7490_005543 [Penicillium lividum]|nr:hypothetical protein N7490_005543 [Penicillium lividum]